MTNQIEIFGFTIYYYAIIMVVAIFISLYLAEYLWKKRGLDINVFNDMSIFMVVNGFIGARIYYVIFSPNINYYLSNPLNIINLREGGLAIHGALIGGLLTFLFFTYKNKISLAKVTDIAAVCLPLAQAIGRWGNFFNQEAHGPAVSREFLTNTLHLPNFIVEGMNISGTYYHPTFLYESVFNTLLFILLLFIYKKNYQKTGLCTGIYLIAYGAVRFLIEILRTDALLIANLKVAQIVSIGMIIIGIILVVKSLRKEKNENSR